MGLSYDQLFPGRFIKAGEMTDKPVTLKIKSVVLDAIEAEDGTEKMQAVVNFVEIKRQWALNKTNAQCLVAMWGHDSDDWVGKRVTLFAEPDTSGMSASGVCLRVKGSPDIDGPVKAEIKLPRRRPIARTLTKTTKMSATVDEQTGEIVDDAAVAAQEPQEDAQDTPNASEAETAETDEIDALEEPALADPIDDMQVRALKSNRTRLKISAEEWHELLDSYGVESATALSHEQAAELITLLQAQTSESWTAQRALV